MKHIFKPGMGIGPIVCSWEQSIVDLFGEGIEMASDSSIEIAIKLVGTIARLDGELIVS
jgi:hypothetical protein